MTKYRIPEPFRPGFKILKSLVVSQTEMLRTVLEQADIGVGPEKLASNLIDKIDLTQEELQNLFNTIFSLINLRIESKTDFPVFLDEIVDSYEQLEVDFSKEEKQMLSENLNVLLNADGKIRKTIKATELLRENERVYSDSRIISDIRIVFDEKFEKPEQSAVIIHHLKIEYFENNQTKDIYFSLDSDDLNQLRETIVRAITKDELLNAKTYTDISFIDLSKY